MYQPNRLFQRIVAPKVGWILLAAVVVVCWGCGRETSLTEVQRVRSGDVDVVLLSRDGSLHQKGTFTIEFHAGSSGNLVNMGTVRAGASMRMPDMAPMLGSIEVRPTEMPGRYTATESLDMAGGWRFALDWDGPSGRGTVNFAGTVQ